MLLVIVGNAAWTLGSIALLFSGAVSPNLLGQVFIVAQAIATGVFAELQYHRAAQERCDGGGVSLSVIPGWCVSTRPGIQLSIRYAAQWIPGSMLRIAPE